MPIYEYKARSTDESCAHCREGFELLRSLSEPRVENCPQCGAPVDKVISAPNIGESATGLDERAKDAGFHKLKKLGKGEYEKEY